MSSSTPENNQLVSDDSSGDQFTLETGKTAERVETIEVSETVEVVCPVEAGTPVDSIQSVEPVHNMLVSDDPLVGSSVVDNRYNISSVIGIGGWSLVYRAHDQSLNRPVAIKIMHSHLCIDSVKVQRFQREAQASSAINHPNVAVIYDCGLLASGRPYITMELVEGQSLAEMIQAGGAMDVERSLDLFGQICDGLAAIHKLGLIHRDLKPSNIKVSSAGTAKVLDFGCAKWILQDEHTLTRSGEAVGTPAYMSPEQCMGKPLDSRSDLYSFGCLMYETVAGVKPFSAENLLECMLMQLKSAPPNFRTIKTVTKVPRALEAVILKTLAKDPEDRFRTAEELKHALADSSSELSIGKKLMLPWRRFGVRQRKQFAAIACGIGLLTVIATIAFWQLMRSRSIVFPDGHEVGSIYLVERGSSGQDKNRYKLCGAQGIVRVPYSSYVQLAEVREQEASNMRFLNKVQANDIQRLDLAGAQITLESIANINRLAHLDTISFFRSSIDDAELEQLHLADLTGLNLTETKIKDAGLFAAVNNFPKVTWIALRGNQYVTDDGVSALAKLERLDALLVDNDPGITDNCLKSLASSKTISLLSMRGDNITDRGLMYLAQTSHVHNLDLSATHISNAGITALSQIQTLRRINISENQISDNSIPQLAQMKHLKALNITSTTITAAGLKRLKSALADCAIKSDNDSVK